MGNEDLLLLNDADTIPRVVVVASCCRPLHPQLLSSILQVIQRFDSAANLNIHLHCLILARAPPRAPAQIFDPLISPDPKLIFLGALPDCVDHFLKGKKGQKPTYFAADQAQNL